MLTTYEELKTSIQSWAKRDDLLDELDTFIDMAEADMWIKLRIRDMLARATATLSGKYIALPTGYIEMRKLVLISGSNTYPLTQQTPESMTDVPSSGIPKSFTVGQQIEFDRTTDASYTVQMHYYRQLTPLSASNTSNAILSRFPMIYLYGALFHFAQWSQDDVMLAKYSDLFDNQMERANKQDRKGRHGPAPAMRTEAATP